MANNSTHEERQRAALQHALRTMQGLQAKLMQMGVVPGSDALGASRRMADLEVSIRQARSALAGRCECISPRRSPYTRDRCICGERLP